MYQATKGETPGQKYIVYGIIFSSGYIANVNLVDHKKQTFFHKGSKQENLIQTYYVNQVRDQVTIKIQPIVQV